LFLIPGACSMLDSQLWERPPRNFSARIDDDERAFAVLALRSGLQSVEHTREDPTIRLSSRSG
jgi:hypothetical protein